MLHKGDFDNQLVGLSMPREISPLYYSLRAFNSEIANVKDSCRGNIAAGDMRLRWWEDVLSCIDNPNHEFSSFKHPVADALYLSCKSLGLSSAMLYRSLDCRRKNLNVTRPKSLDELEDYAERAYSSLNYMLIEALGIKDDEVDMMASHFGVSSGLCLLIMSIPYHSNELYIPEETAQKFNLTMSIARGTFANPEGI
jgi:phytoene/squalene synthetase